MVKLDLGALRQKLDLETKYVDFSVLRTSLSVLTLLMDLETNLTAPTKEGECRGSCPKCRKGRSFALNINTNRFNCFAKGCILKGGGVIDFVAKLFEVPAKEASHLLACAYGIQPYTSPEEPIGAEKIGGNSVSEIGTAVAQTGQAERNREAGSVSRAEFDALAQKVERLTMIVWSQMFETGETSEPAELFDEQEDYELKAALSA